MNPEEAIRQALQEHRWSDLEWDCRCRAGVTLNQLASHQAAVVVGVLTTNGWALTALPEAEPIKVVGMQFNDQDGEGEPECWLTVAVPQHWQPDLSMDDFDKPLGLRVLAAALLAAAVSPTQKEPVQ